MDSFFSPMQRTIYRNLLKHAAGQTMFCPVCETCLDWKKTVVVDVGGGHLIRVLCRDCWDNKVLPFVSSERLAACEITDFRTLG
jgi:RNase P subunit RPR2